MKSGWAWVVLTFAEARDVAAVEVVGVNLPEGMRVLLSEDADDWFEDEGGPGAVRVGRVPRRIRRGGGSRNPGSGGQRPAGAVTSE